MNSSHPLCIINIHNKMNIFNWDAYFEFQEDLIHLPPDNNYNLTYINDNDTLDKCHSFTQQMITNLSHASSGVRDLPRQIAIPNFNNVFIPVSVAAFDEIHSTLLETLEATDSVVIDDNSAAQWCIWIRYGTLPIFPTLEVRQRAIYDCKKEILIDLCSIVKLKQVLNVGIRHFMYGGAHIDPIKIDKYESVVREAALKARNKMPHNFSYSDDYIPMPTSIFAPRLWSDTCIYYTRDAITGSIVAEFERVLGDHKSANFIRHTMTEALSTPNLLWRKRRAYISLLEGTNMDTNKSHITRYLLNFYVCYEVCQF